MGNPDALAGVVLIDTGILPGYKWHSLARIWRTPVLGELFQAASTGRAFTRGLASKEPRGLPSEFLEGMGEPLRPADQARRAEALPRNRRPGRGGARSSRRSWRPRNLPALVIWGEEDAYLPAAYAERQRDAFPAADVHVLPASGHWPFADSPEAVERLLIEYLEGAARSTAGRTG